MGPRLGSGNRTGIHPPAPARRKQRRPKWPGVVLALVCLATIAALVWHFTRQQAKPLETAAGYIASTSETAPLYDEEGAVLEQLIRGSQVNYVVEEASDDHPDQVRVPPGGRQLRLAGPGQPHQRRQRRGDAGDGVCPPGPEPDGRGREPHRPPGAPGPGPDRYRLPGTGGGRQRGLLPGGGGLHPRPVCPADGGGGHCGL